MNLIAIAGDNCREIYSAAVDYMVYDAVEGREVLSPELIYPISDINFLWLLEPEDVQEQLGQSGLYVRPWNVRFLDRDGNDITEQYRDAGVEQSWGGGKSTAEQFLLYVYIGIVAVLGAVFLLYFLRRD